MASSVFKAASGARIEIRCEDCLKGIGRLAPDSVDVVVTSPPYNLGVKYSGYDDSGPREEYLCWIEEWALAVRRVLSLDGSLFLNVGSKPSDPWVAMDVALRLRRHYQLQNTIVWVKSIAIEAAAQGSSYGPTWDLALGHYKPINSPRYLNDCFEYVFHFTHSGAVPLDRMALGVPYRDKSNIGRWKQAKSDRRCRGNTWFLPYETICSRDRQRPHPATFPAKLPEWCFLLHGRERITRCMDPFLGIGSTALAAARLGLSFIGYEIDEQYYQVAVERLTEECGPPV